jgi:hypothetical protein
MHPNLPCRQKLTAQAFSEAQSLFVSVVAESLFHHRDPETKQINPDVIEALSNLKDGSPLVITGAQYQRAFREEFTPLGVKVDWLTWVTMSFFTRAGDTVDFTDQLVESLLEGLDLEGPMPSISQSPPAWRMFGLTAVIDELAGWIKGYNPLSSFTQLDPAPVDVMRVVLRNNKHILINLLAVYSRQKLSEITEGATNV